MSHHFKIVITKEISLAVHEVNLVYEMLKY